MVKALKLHSEKLYSDVNTEMKKSIMKLSLENEALKKNLDEALKKNQDEMKKNQDEMKKNQDEQTNILKELREMMKK